MKLAWVVVVSILGCMAAGVAMTAVLSDNGMAVQDAFNSGMAFALLPVIAVGIIGVLYWFFS